MLNLSSECGTVPQQWRRATVTPVPELMKPESVGDYRSISVTPVLSRLAEKLVVSKWLLPNIPSETFADQFGYWLSGSTTCVLVYLLHHVTEMLD